MYTIVISLHNILPKYKVNKQFNQTKTIFINSAKNTYEISIRQYTFINSPILTKTNIQSIQIHVLPKKACVKNECHSLNIIPSQERTKYTYSILNLVKILEYSSNSDHYGVTQNNSTINPNSLSNIGRKCLNPVSAKNQFLFFTAVNTCQAAVERTNHHLALRGVGSYKER